MISPKLFFSKLTEPFIKMWRGKQPLPVAFWLFFVLGNFFIGPIVLLLLGSPFVWLGQRQNVFTAFFVLGIVYVLYSAVGVWRSANAYLLVSPKSYAIRAFNAVGAKIVVCIVLGIRFQNATGITFMGLLHRVTSN